MPSPLRPGWLSRLFNRIPHSKRLRKKPGLAVERLEDRELLANQAFPQPLDALAPFGSLIFSKSQSESLSLLDNADSYTLPLAAGQLVTAALQPGDPSLQAGLRLRGPGGALLAMADPGAAGETVVIQAAPASAAGTYVLDVTGLSGAGGYTVRVTLNAAVEEEGLLDGATNNSRAAAQSLDATALPLPGAATRLGVTGVSGSGDDYYSFTLQAGQTATLALSAQAAGPRLELEDSAGTLLALGSRGAADTDEVIAGFVAPADGVYYARVRASAATSYGLVVTRGAGFDVEPNNTRATANRAGPTPVLLGSFRGTSSVAAITGETEPNNSIAQANDLSGSFTLSSANTYAASVQGVISQSGERDYFKIYASPGDTLVLDEFGSSAGGSAIGDPYVFLYNNAGQLLASNDDYYGLNSHLTFTFGGSTSAYAGDYYLVAGGYSSHTGGYTLTAQLTTPRPIGISDSQDHHAFQAAAGDVLTLVTATPGDPAAEPINNLDPLLALYDPAGNLVASNNNGADDGRNARITYTVPSGAGGAYVARVATVTGVGDYTLEITGATGGTTQPVTVTSSPLVNNSVVTAFPGTLRLGFSQPLLLSSLSAGDLTINGAPATSVSVIDARTVEFSLAGLSSGDGTYAVRLPAGVLNDMSGNASAAYAVDFRLDGTGPVVTASSVGSQDVVPAGDLTYVATFSEDLATAGLGSEDVSLVNDLSGQAIAASSFSYDASNRRLTATFRGLVDSNYTLTLRSGASAFRDPVGNLLNGAPSFPLPSGQGHPGGDDFVVHFTADTATANLPSFAAQNPAGSLIHEAVAVGALHTASDSDSFLLTLDAGQTVTVVLTALDGDALPVVRVIDPDGLVAGTGAAAAAGGPALVQTAPVATAGTYRIDVLNSQGSGRYQLRVLLNAAAEEEGLTTGDNNSLTGAQGLDDSSVAVPGIVRLVGVGKADGAAADFYSFHLGQGEAASLEATATGGTLSMELHDGDGNVLARGASAENVRQFIRGFVAPAAGLYYARLGGSSGTAYSVVVTRGGDFDVEPNDAATNAAELTGGAVLGSLEGGGGLGGDLTEGNASSWSVWANDGASATASNDFSQRRVGASSLRISTTSGDAVFIRYPGSGSLNLDLSAVAALNVSFRANNPSPTGFQNRSPSIFLGSSEGAFAYEPNREILNDARSGWLDLRIPLTGDSTWQRSVFYGNPSLSRIEWIEFAVDTWDSGFDLWIDGLSFANNSSDGYRIYANAGDAVHITTATPGDGTGQPANELRPALELYSPSGTLVASNTGGASDGRNSLLNYVVPGGAGGAYRVVIRSTGNSGGDYTLQVSGASGSPPPLTATALSPAPGASFLTAPTTAQIRFAAPLLLTSIDAADLRLDGVAATAVTQTGPDTLAFTLPAISQDGTHTLTLGAGSLTSLAGQPLAAFSSTFSVDTAPPRVTAVSIGEGGVVPAGAVTFRAEFSEALNPSGLGAEDVLLRETASGVSYVPASFAYDQSAHAVIVSQDLPEGTYQLTLTSGASGFRDTTGNLLAGSPSFPLPSGGTAGNFVVNFSTDAGSSAFPAPLSAEAPSGSLVYSGTATGLFNAADDLDSFTLSIDPGQTVSLVLTPLDGALRVRVALIAPDGSTLGSADASAPGQPALLQTLPAASAGTYRIDATSLAGSGRYQILVVLNAAIEAEGRLANVNNDSLAGAQDLGASATALPAGGSRLAVLGGEAGDDFYAFTLAAGQSASLTLTAAGSARLELMNAASELLAQGAAGSTNVTEAIGGFVAPTAGTYFARVRGISGGRYALVVTRGAAQDVEPNGNPESAQDLTLNRVALGAIGRGGGGAGLRVAVVRANSNGDDAGFRAIVDQLNDRTYYNFQATLAGPSQIDTLAELNAYDVVVIGNNGYSGDNYGAAAAALRSWVQAGGGIVETGWGVYAAGSLPSAQRADLDAIVPVNLLGSYSYTTGQVTISATTHPITAGLSNFSSGGAYVEYPTASSPVDAGATILATISGRPAVVAGSSGAGRGVYLGPIYTGYSGYNLSSLRTGIPDRLLEQAVAWAGLGSDVADQYAFAASEGDELILRTTTPGDGADEPANGFDPTLELYAPDGSLVAVNDNGAADGRNAQLSYTVPEGAGGLYRVAVRGVSGSRGEYTLAVEGATGQPAPFTATAVTPADGAQLAGYPESYTLRLSQPVLLTSVQAADLTVDGAAASAVTIVDAQTLRFDLTGTAHGDALYHVALAAGSLTSLSGAPLAAFSATFDSDATSPGVTSSSLAEGAVTAAGDLVYQVVFSEELASAGLGVEDATLTDRITGSVRTPDVLSYDAASSTATLTFRDVAESDYTLTLLTSAAAFRDRRGNTLTGGPFVVRFTADNQGLAFPSPLPLLTPLAALVARGTATGRFHAADDADSFTLPLDAGQSLTLRLDAPSVAARAEVLGPDGTVLGSASADAGQPLLLQAVPAVDSGVYVIRVTALSGTGNYTLQATLNAVVEPGGDNDSRQTAVDLSAAAVALQAGARRYAALGQIGAGDPADYYTVTLAAQPATLVLTPTVGSGARLELHAADGTLLALGTADSDGSQRIADFVPQAGAYYLRVSGAAGMAYTLVVTAGATLEREPNFDPSSAQPLATRQVLGALGRRSSQAGDAIRVAVLSSSASALINQLNDSTAFRFQAQTVTAAQIDTVAELNAFDAVLIGDSNSRASLAQAGAALRAWVESGGGLIATGWTIYAAGSATGTPLTDVDAVVPVDTTASYGYSQSPALHVTDAGHFVTQGLSDFSVPNYVEFSPNGADAGAVVLATVNGAAAVVVGAPQAGRSVYLGPTYVNQSGLTTGPSDRLLEQAVAWAGGVDRADAYRFTAAEGASLVLRTTAPLGGPNEPENTLAPQLELYNALGLLVASDDAEIRYTVPAGEAGRYVVRVLGQSDAAGAGPYTLTFEGASAEPAAPLTVTASTPADAAHLAAAPPTLRQFADGGCGRSQPVRRIVQCGRPGGQRGRQRLPRDGRRRRGQPQPAAGQRRQHGAGPVAAGRVAAAGPRDRHARRPADERPHRHRHGRRRQPRGRFRGQRQWLALRQQLRLSERRRLHPVPLGLAGDRRDYAVRRRRHRPRPRYRRARPRLRAGVAGLPAGHDAAGHPDAAAPQPGDRHGPGRRRRDPLGHAGDPHQRGQRRRPGHPLRRRIAGAAAQRRGRHLCPQPGGGQVHLRGAGGGRRRQRQLLHAAADRHGRSHPGRAAREPGQLGRRGGLRRRRPHDARAGDAQRHHRGRRPGRASGHPAMGQGRRPRRVPLHTGRPAPRRQLLHCPRQRPRRQRGDANPRRDHARRGRPGRHAPPRERHRARSGRRTHQRPHGDRHH